MQHILGLVLGMLALLGTTGAVTADMGDGSSRDEPLAIGNVVRVGDFEVMVLSINPDAEDEVLAVYDFNTPAQLARLW